MEYAPPQFFHRGPAPIARLTFFALLSVLLMVLDARFRYAEPMRQLLALAVYPLQQLAIAPVSALTTAAISSLRRPGCGARTTSYAARS